MANAKQGTVTQSKESFPAAREADTHLTLPTGARAPLPAPTEQNKSLDAEHDPYDNVACTD
jgi:hypothetical protein